MHVIYSYKPMCVFDLVMLMQYHNRQQQEKRYMSDIQWLNARCLFGFVTGGKGEFPLRPASQAFKEENKKGNDYKPAESSADIRQRLINRLGGGDDGFIPVVSEDST